MCAVCKLKLVFHANSYMCKSTLNDLRFGMKSVLFSYVDRYNTISKYYIVNSQMNGHTRKIKLKLLPVTVIANSKD